VSVTQSRQWGVCKTPLTCPPLPLGYFLFKVRCFESRLNAAQDHKTKIGDHYQISSIRAQDNKTKTGDQSQISSIWLAEMATGHHFSQSDAWYMRLVSKLRYMILGPGSNFSQSDAWDSPFQPIRCLRFETSLQIHIYDYGPCFIYVEINWI
jgi:hypothetical protein